MEDSTFGFFKRLLQSKNMIISIDEADLFIIPESPGQHAGIGFKTISYAKAGQMDGVVQITATFKMPEGSLEGDIIPQSVALNKSIASLKFIKTTGPLESMNSTGNVLCKKKKEQ